RRTTTTPAASSRSSRSEERRVGKECRSRWSLFSYKKDLTSVTPASSAPVLQTHKATSSTLYFYSLTVNAGNCGFLHCIQMDTSVNAANQVVSVGADIAVDADPKFFFFFSSRRRHTRWPRDWSSDVCSSDLDERQQRRRQARAR